MCAGGGGVFKFDRLEFIHCYDVVSLKKILVFTVPSHSHTEVSVYVHIVELAMLLKKYNSTFLLYLNIFMSI